MTHEEELHKHLLHPQKIYIGFDPTSDSLHLGNFIPLMGLFWFLRSGHHPIALVGGATAMVGDPRGTAERSLLDPWQIETNSKGIQKVLQRILQERIPLMNNADWLGKFSLIDFLRDVGKHFRVGPMLTKETVRQRLESEEGISFTEFSYQTLQGYDFLHLFDHHAVTIQAGGSDQWGNITAGTDLIRKVRGKHAYGITFPLLVRSDGKKFGKSEGVSVWLSEEKTSVYDFYQYIFSTPDADIGRMMRLLTFMEMSEIKGWEKAMKEPSYVPNSAQSKLAEEVTRIVHGDEGVTKALSLTKQFAPGKEADLSESALLVLKKEAGSYVVADLVGLSIVDLLAMAGLVPSKSEARRLIQNGGISLNGQKVASLTQVIEENDLLYGQFLLLSVGKKTRRLVERS